MIKIIMSVLFGLSCAFTIELGKVPPKIVLEGEKGSKIDGNPWNSQSLKGKIYTLFYVDPDKKELNQALAYALKSKGFNRDKVASVAIINLAATWIPNALLEKMLEKKQKEFPHTLYVKDKKKILVKQWQLADDNSDILIFNKEGKLIYKKFGKVSKSEISKVLTLIENHL